MTIGSSILQRSLLLAPVLFGLCGMAALAQTAPASKAADKKSHSVSGSPLDTLRSTHLWADTAPAKDFVKESRPDPTTLDYAPLTGVDPERPKPRDAANVLALQAEMERAHDVNDGKGKPLRGVRSHKISR